MAEFTISKLTDVATPKLSDDGADLTKSVIRDGGDHLVFGQAGAGCPEMLCGGNSPIVGSNEGFGHGDLLFGSDAPALGHGELVLTSIDKHGPLFFDADWHLV